MLELKPSKQKPEQWPSWSYNRTMLELKQANAVVGCYQMGDL